MYVYNAELWCDDCAEELRANARAMGATPADDSDDWPHYAPEGETDSPNHCASGSDCRAAIDLLAYADSLSDFRAEDGRYRPTAIGALLDEELTPDGVAYVAGIFAEPDPTPYQEALHRVWSEAFNIPTTPALMDAAREAGADHGRGAAGWYFDGNTTDATYRAVLAGLDDGDPAVLDTFPSAPLSGEWADDPTPASVCADLGIEEDDPRADDAIRAYEDAFHEAAYDEIERVARLQLAPEPARACLCPDDCNCHHPWRPNYCGCKQHA